MSFESVRLTVATSLTNPPWCNPLRLKGQFVELFQKILTDQSDSVPYPMYKSKWTTGDRQKAQALHKEFSQLVINEKTPCEKCLGPLENIALRLSPLIKTQLGKLELKGVSTTSNIIGKEGEVIAGLEKNYRSPVFEGEVVINFKANKGNSVFQTDVVVNDKTKVKLKDAHILKAVDDLDYFYSELFSRYLCKREIHKALEALAKLSYFGIKKITVELNPVADYCNELISENKIQNVITIYESCLTEVNGAFHIKSLNEKLLAFDQNHRDKVKVIISSLNPATIAKIQGWVEDCIDKDQLSTAATCLEVLMLCDDCALWSHHQLAQVIQKYIKNGNDDIAFQLIDKYLWNDPKSNDQALECVKNLIQSYLHKGFHFEVIELINKLNKPETQPQAIVIVEDTIRAYVKGEDIMENEVGACIDNAKRLIDKYLWNNPNYHTQAVSLVKECIESQIDKRAMDAAYKFINKYMKQNDYINELVSRKIDINVHHARELYDRYMSLQTLNTEVEFDNCCRLILKNIHTEDNKKKQLESDIRKLVLSPNLTEQHKNILRNFIMKMAEVFKDKIVILLCFAKTHIKDNEFVQELASIFVKHIYDLELKKSIQALFISQ